MNIGQAAAATGMTAKSIRYYESVGLIAAADRRTNNYRAYDARAIAELRFIQRARSLGFPVKDVGDLLALWRDRSRASAQVHAMAAAHVDAIERKILELQTMKAALQNLLRRCHNDDRPACPILDDLARAGGLP
jgi:MerR family transcriptional regulator, copper efflux regulator